MVEDKSGGVHRACDSKGLRANQLFGLTACCLGICIQESGQKPRSANKKGRKCCERSLYQIPWDFSEGKMCSLNLTGQMDCQPRCHGEPRIWVSVGDWENTQMLDLWNYLRWEEGTQDSSWHIRVSCIFTWPSFDEVWWTSKASHSGRGHLDPACMWPEAIVAQLGVVFCSLETCDNAWRCFWSFYAGGRGCAALNILTRIGCTPWSEELDGSKCQACQGWEAASRGLCCVWMCLCKGRI